MGRGLIVCLSLAAATLLTLLVVPALYLFANDLRRTVYWLRRGGDFPSAEAVEPLRTRHSL